MPADASIYSMLQPLKPPPDPLQQYGQMMQIGNLMDAGAVNQLQRRKMESDLAEEEAVKQLFARGTPTADQLSAISPARGMQFRKSQLEDETGRANLAKTRAETLVKQLGIHRDQLASVNDQPGAVQWIMAGFNDPVLSPILQRMGGPQEHIAKIPQDPKGLADWKMRNGLGIEKLVEATAPKATLADTGPALVPTQTNPLAAGGVGPIAGAQPIPKTASPESLLADKRAREAAERDKFGPPQEVTGPDGKPRLAVQNKNTGAFHDANTLQPIPNIGPKLGETAQKQQVGVQNTKNAIAEYRAALDKFTLADIANPNARAKMGTVYNNMLLQAKEAFNLGVLNGPDYAILQEVITNPTSLKGGITSKAALDEQASKLDEIMGRVGQQITATQSGQETAPPKPAAPKTFDKMPDPSQHKGKRIRADDGTIYKSDGSSWKRQ